MSSETLDNAESGEESGDDLIMKTLIGKEEMDAMDSGSESDDEPMSTEMLEYIFDGVKSHPILNRRESRYKISDRIKRRQTEWKG